LAKVLFLLFETLNFKDTYKVLNFLYVPKIYKVPINENKSSYSNRGYKGERRLLIPKVVSDELGTKGQEL